ncbi:unnamed protein product [Moneuplotes crassus]|uniref:Uncharacterized protein n=1 Tax=Euplotes crassus TaxID=5936 RepID=A0AAD1XBI3_EUPCR|nr:unnamed protein product [Moneuplotes crassus]
MEILETKEEKFNEIIKVLHPKSNTSDNSEEVMLYYYYNLDYTSKKEEEHKLEAWNRCMIKAFEVEHKLFMTIDDVYNSLSFNPEDEKALSPIIKNLKKEQQLVSSSAVLEGIGKNFQESHSYFSKFMKKIITSFGLGTNIGELSKGLYCPFDLLEERADEIHDSVIKSQIISERKIRDFLKIKYCYDEIEQEILLIHMKNNKMIEICQVTIKDETSGEEIDHRAAFSIENVGENNEKNLKVFELEVNLYALSDAIEEIEDIKKRIKQKITSNNDEGKEDLLAELFRNIVYAEEVWVNIARSITLIEEEIKVFDNANEMSIQLLIRQSRRDIFFFEKCKKYLNKCLEDEEESDSEDEDEENDEDEEDEEEATENRSSQSPEKSSLPPWIRKVEINEEEIQKEINLLLAEKCAQDTDDLLKEFTKKVQFDIKARETMNIDRRSIQNSEMTCTIPNSYMDTITKFQEFFGFDENFELKNNDNDPFEVEFRVSRVRQDYEKDEENCPDIRMSVLMKFDANDDEDGESSEHKSDISS